MSSSEGVTIVVEDGIFIIWPILNKSLVKLLTLIKSLTLTPYCLAIEYKLSPLLTTYDIFVSSAL